MNYEVRLNQAVLSEWRGNIDANDAVILAHIEGLLNSKSAAVAQYRWRDYVWISYRKLLQDNPLLHIGVTALRDRLRKLRKLGILRSYTTPEKAGTRRAYYKFTKTWDESVEHYKKVMYRAAARRNGWSDETPSPRGPRKQTGGEARKQSDTAARKQTDGDPKNSYQAQASPDARMDVPDSPLLSREEAADRLREFGRKLEDL